ncbi:MAG: GTP cyclohydrolase II [Robiginitomaculum sp.]|nr:MAG: GTP cyclohydrolase II [Robiginitomaculum sp.]
MSSVQTNVVFKACTDLPTRYGSFKAHVFIHKGQEHLALVLGEIGANNTVLTRVHSECLTGDSLFSLRCDCGPQLAFAMDMMRTRKSGLLIYLRQEGRGIGLVEKIKAYALQDGGEDTVTANLKLGHPADNRHYDMLKGVFAYFGVTQIDLLTNNPEKISAIKTAGIEIKKRIPIKVGHNAYNHVYIQTKADKFKHL